MIGTKLPRKPVIFVVGNEKYGFDVFKDQTLIREGFATLAQAEKYAAVMREAYDAVVF